MTTHHDKPKRWRPWQFGLRTLLLLMFGVGCYFAGWTANERKRQRELERSQTLPDPAVFGRLVPAPPSPASNALDELFGEPAQPGPGDDLDELFGEPAGND